MNKRQPAEIARVLLLYEQEVSPRARAEALFAGSDAEYVAQWTDRFALGLTTALASMDQATTDRYLEQALARCGEAARAWWQKR